MNLESVEAFDAVSRVELDLAYAVRTVAGVVIVGAMQIGGKWVSIACHFNRLFVSKQTFRSAEEAVAREMDWLADAELKPGSCDNCGGAH